jgi:hypothetical protein
MPMYDINSKMLDMQVTTSLDKTYYVIKSIYQKEDIVEITIAYKESKLPLYLIEANADMLRNTSYAISHANRKLNDDLEEVVQEPVSKIPDLYVIDKTNNYNKFNDSATETLIIRKINGARFTRFRNLKPMQCISRGKN